MAERIPTTLSEGDVFMSQFSRLSPGLRSIIGSLGGITAALLLLSGCGGLQCTLKGCGGDLSIFLGSGFDKTKSYSIDVNDVTGTGSLLTSCTLAPATGGESPLKCSAEVAKWTGPYYIRLDGVRPAKVLVTVSAGGAKLSEQMFAPVYEDQEINGRGCGVCTTARVDLNIP